MYLAGKEMSFQGIAEFNVCSVCVTNVMLVQNIGSFHELWLFTHSSTGFDLCEVGQEEVILKTGKQANRRTMHFALQSLLALFGKAT